MKTKYDKRKYILVEKRDITDLKKRIEKEYRKDSVLSNKIIGMIEYFVG